MTTQTAHPIQFVNAVEHEAYFVREWKPKVGDVVRCKEKSSLVESAEREGEREDRMRLRFLERDVDSTVIRSYPALYFVHLNVLLPQKEVLRFIFSDIEDQAEDYKKYDKQLKEAGL